MFCFELNIEAIELLLDNKGSDQNELFLLLQWGLLFLFTFQNDLWVVADDSLALPNHYLLILLNFLVLKLKSHLWELNVEENGF